MRWMRVVVCRFMAMLASTVGSIIMPACSGEKPRQTCSTSGIRKGMQELPRRENRLPSRPTRRLRTANSSGANSGSGRRSACSQ